MPLVDNKDAANALAKYLRQEVDKCPVCTPAGICDEHYREFNREFAIANKLQMILDDLATPTYYDVGKSDMPDEEMVWAMRLGKDQIPWKSTMENVRKTAELFPQYRYVVARRVEQTPPIPPADADF